MKKVYTVPELAVLFSKYEDLQVTVVSPSGFVLSVHFPTNPECVHVFDDRILLRFLADMFYINGAVQDDSSKVVRCLDFCEKENECSFKIEEGPVVFHILLR